MFIPRLVFIARHSLFRPHVDSLHDACFPWQSFILSDPRFLRRPVKFNSRDFFPPRPLSPATYFRERPVYDHNFRLVPHAQDQLTHWDTPTPRGKLRECTANSALETIGGRWGPTGGASRKPSGYSRRGWYTLKTSSMFPYAFPILPYAIAMFPIIPICFPITFLCLECHDFH